MEIEISRVHYPVTTLGPGNRIGIWLQGCSIHCKGCISMDTWQFGINKIALAELEKVLKLWLPQCDGITISGGEPFDQEAQLIELLNFIKPYNKSILLYSGYPYALLKDKNIVQNKLIDVLISEPYDHLEAQTKRLLGSDNQKVHFITNLGEIDFKTYLELPFPKKLDVQIIEDTVWMAGIPFNGMNEIDEVSKKDKVTISHSQAVINNK